MIKFDQSVCSDLAQASSREWLETNGIGGFAAATIAGTNTRRYHGLLTAALKPPVARTLLLSKLEETLLVGEERFDLATNHYEGAVHPQGYRSLVEFRLDPFPTFTFEVGGVQVEKSLFLLHGSNTVVVEYKLLKAPAKTKVALEVRPLIAFRDYHSTTHENGSINGGLQRQPGLVSVEPYPGMPRLYIAHNAGSVEPQGFWYRDFSYEVERERGLDFLEDLFNPLVMRFDLTKKKRATVIASTEVHDVAQATEYRESELARRAKVAAAAPVANDFVRQLALAADQFLVRRGDGSTVIAGYPWFTDWGRDTMIALPGLTLYTGNHDIARQVLLKFAEHVDQGMLPNLFPDQGERAEFNTVDATLWYFEAIRAYAARTGDHATVREKLYPVLKDIIDWHIRGTRYGIHMLENGLLNAGEPGVQLTWMDAKIGDWVVTPRSGKPVEIQALWFNALKIMEEFATRFEDVESQKRYRTLSAMTQWTFNRVFWNEQRGCLYDVANGMSDGSLRPNQIFAVSLPHSMLSPERARAVVDVVERELLTPYGLRTLDRNDARYCPVYSGDPLRRDSAYHQGTVWPWLLGPFVSAYIKVHGNTAEVRERAEEFLLPLNSHLNEAGLGQISEIFDGDSPHLPRGCFAQAWSVAEVLRALCEDVYQVKVEAVPAKRTAKVSASRAAASHR